MITDGLTPLTVVLFAALVLGSAGALAAIGLALACRRWVGAKRIAVVEVAGLVLYGAAYLAASLASHDRVLGREAEKHICEIDCHLAYSVIAVRTAPALGSPLHPVAAHGVFYIITVRVRFDSATISPRRGMGPLTPNGRDIALVDDRGRRYELSREGQNALPAAPGETRPLTRSLIPGQVYSAELTFDVPSGATGLRLILSERDLPTEWLIGHENSLWHGKTTFRIAA